MKGCVYTVRNLSGGMNGVWDEKVVPLGFSVQSFNFNHFDGTLKDGLGLEKFASGNNGLCLATDGDVYALKLFYYKCDGELLLIYCSDGYIYRYGKDYDTLAEKITDLYFAKTPNGVCYNYCGQDIFIFSGEEGVFGYDGQSVTALSFADGVRDIQIYNERLYLVTESQPDRLWYSDDFNPFNFAVSLNEGGYIDLADELGEIKKLACYGGHLYLFRSYGISRFTGYFDQSEFMVEKLFCSTGKIYPSSVTVCGDGVIFLTADGFYRVYGYKVKKILDCYDGFLQGVDNSLAKGAYLNGVLYLSCKMKFEGKEQDVLVVCRLSDYASYLASGLRIKDIETLFSESKGEVALIITNSRHIYTFGQACVLDGVPLKKVWKTPFFDFGKGGVKVLEKISFYLKGSVKLTIKSDYAQLKIFLKSKGGQVAEKIGIRGNRFSFTIESVVPCTEIATLSVEYLSES